MSDETSTPDCHTCSASIWCGRKLPWCAATHGWAEPYSCGSWVADELLGEVAEDDK